MKFSLNKLLLYILAFIVAVIAVTTLIALAHGKKPSRMRQLNPEYTNKAEKTTFSAYSGFGRLRAVTRPEKDSPPASIIFTPWFSCQKEDSAFYEELAQKSMILKNLMIKYFDSHTVNELKALGEERVKQELTALINSELVLDKITAIYFSEYIFLE